MRRNLLITLILLIFLSSCSPTIKTPAGFARVQDPPSPYIYKAVSGDDVIVGVRKVTNNPRGNLEFWKDLLPKKLTYAKGYTFKNQEDLKTAGGLAGTLFTFTTPGSDGRTYAYLLFLAPDGDDLWLIEAGGPVETVRKYRPRILELIRSFDP